jgi:hypothetical protein
MLQKMTKIGIFTFFAGLQNSLKIVFESFLTKIDINQPKEQKKKSKIGILILCAKSMTVQSCQNFEKNNFHANVHNFINNEYF